MFIKYKILKHVRSHKILTSKHTHTNHLVSIKSYWLSDTT